MSERTISPEAYDEAIRTLRYVLQVTGDFKTLKDATPTRACMLLGEIGHELLHSIHRINRLEDSPKSE